MSLFNPQTSTLQIQTIFYSLSMKTRFNSSGSSEILVHEANSRIRINNSWISVICVLLLLLVIQSSSSEPEIITVDVHKANQLLRNGEYRYLDVRTPGEFKEGHVDFVDALNIPYMVDTHQGRVKNGNFVEQVLSLCSKGDHLVVGCKSGVRSVYASKLLLEAGFKHVYNMGGGYVGWVENNLPVAELTSKVEL